jgi:hypothetical protein
MTLAARPHAIFTADMGEAQAVAARKKQRCKPSPSRWQICSNFMFHRSPGQVEARWIGLTLDGHLSLPKNWFQWAGHGMGKEAAA